MVFQQQHKVETRGHRDMQDLTDAVARVISESRIGTGIVHVFNAGSTAAITTIEFEPGLQRDLPEALDRLLPPNKDYGHEQRWHDGNGHSHLQASAIGPAVTIPVTGGRPALGTWQQVILLECDIRPRNRTVVITVIGE
jgi:secondary thiamine-phosphate synthase enzyme